MRPSRLRPSTHRIADVRDDPRLAPVPDWLSMPLYYGSLSCFRVYFETSREALASLLAGTETLPADLAGSAVYSLDF